MYLDYRTLLLTRFVLVAYPTKLGNSFPAFILNSSVSPSALPAPERF